MSEKLLPCPFCGGEAEVRYQSDLYGVRCEKCLATVAAYDTEAEAIEAWNRRAAAKNATTPEVRTAKVIEHDASVTDTDGYKYHRSEYLCGACKKKVLGGDEYCSHCGCRLDWGEDIPMEYFESGGI